MKPLSWLLWYSLDLLTCHNVLLQASDYGILLYDIDPLSELRIRASLRVELNSGQPPEVTITSGYRTQPGCCPVEDFAVFGDDDLTFVAIGINTGGE